MSEKKLSNVPDGLAGINKTETDKNKIDKAIALTADLWNAMMLLPEGYVDQHHDMRFHTHALQNIIKSCNR